jgi:Na+-transporting NADH:ubiquinone oxidoreductase subunit NqrC
MEQFVTFALQFGIDTTIGKVVWGVAGVVMVANVVTMLTPTRADNALLDKVLGLVNVAALNILKNKNKDSEK